MNIKSFIIHIQFKEDSKYNFYQRIEIEILIPIDSMITASFLLEKINVHYEGIEVYSILNNKENKIFVKDENIYKYLDDKNIIRMTLY